MYLVDTSVWIDHFNKSEPLLVSFLNDNVVCTHPFIIGEIALGNLRQREIVIGYFHGLPQACVSSDFEVMHFISKKNVAWKRHWLCRCTSCDKRLTDEQHIYLDS